jgi:multisubunit Na+/H+ antiporter MnhB subunit
VSTGVLGFVLACACFTSGTCSPSLLVAQQTASPLGWKAFTHPELAVGAWLFTLHASRMLALLAPSAWLSAFARAGLALVASCVFFGGHAAPELGFLAFVPGTALGIFALVIKVLALTAWLGALQPMASRAGAWSTAVGCFAIALGTVAWTFVENPRSIELFLGGVTFPTWLGSLLLAWLQAQYANITRVRSASHASPLA